MPTHRRALRVRSLPGATAVTLLLGSTTASAEPTRNATGDAATTFGALEVGIATFVASYAPAAIVAATSERASDRYLYAPVAGPLLSTLARSCGGPCTGEPAYDALIVFDGLVQTAGAVQIVASLIWHDEMSWNEAGTSLWVAPMDWGRGRYGWVATATF